MPAWSNWLQYNIVHDTGLPNSAWHITSYKINIIHIWFIPCQRNLLWFHCAAYIWLGTLCPKCWSVPHVAAFRIFYTRCVFHNHENFLQCLLYRNCITVKLIILAQGHYNSFIKLPICRLRPDESYQVKVVFGRPYMWDKAHGLYLANPSHGLNPPCVA